VGKTEKERGVRKRNHKMLGYTAMVQAQIVQPTYQPNSLFHDKNYNTSCGRGTVFPILITIDNSELDKKKKKMLMPTYKS